MHFNPYDFSNLIDILDEVGDFDLITTYDCQNKTDDINMAFFREQVQAGYPVQVATALESDLSIKRASGQSFAQSITNLIVLQNPGK